MKLFECSFADPPEREAHYSVQPIGTIKTDFSDISIDELDSRYNDKLMRTVWQYNFKVEVKFRAKEGVLTFRSTAYGKERGRTQIAYE